MKSIKIIALVTTALLSASILADVYVHGYNRKDGTYVQPHYRSDPNGNQNDNWSTKGNINPYTGKEGHLNLDRDKQGLWNSEDNNNPSHFKET